MAFKLPRLPINWREQPQLFERYWDETLFQIEKTLNAILSLPAIEQAIQEAQTAADNAQNAALVAQGAASTAQTAADSALSVAAAAQAQTEAQLKEASLVNSFVTGFTAPLVSANDLGGVTIASHQRNYGNGTLVSVTGATIPTTAVPDETVRVYYVDSARTGGAVSYLYTVDPDPAPVQGGDTHSVAAVIIPSTGIKEGKPLTGPGYINVPLN